MKKVVWIIGVVLCLITTSILSLELNKVKRSDKQKNTQEKIIQITEFNIVDRTNLKVEDTIYVGNNLKELENNFYDIKITNEQYGICVYLNKLWYETYGVDYIQDNYLAQICRELSYKLNMKGEPEQFEYIMYKYIKDNYTKVRQNEEIEQISADKYNLQLKLEDSVAKLIIRSSDQ